MEFFKSLSTLGKVALLLGGVLFLGVLLYFGVDAADSIGFNK